MMGPFEILAPKPVGWRKSPSDFWSSNLPSRRNVRRTVTTIHGAIHSALTSQVTEKSEWYLYLWHDDSAKVRSSAPEVSAKRTQADMPMSTLMQPVCGTAPFGSCNVSSTLHSLLCSVQCGKGLFCPLTRMIRSLLETQNGVSLIRRQATAA